MQRLDKLRIPEETRKYLRDTINPILEDMITKVLVDKPVDAVQYMYDYLSSKLNRTAPSDTADVVAMIASSSVALDSSSSDDDDDDELCATRPSSKEKVYTRKARVAVSAEAVGEWNKDEVWSPPKHEKSMEQKARLIEILQGSFLFSSLDKDDRGIIVHAMEHVNVSASEEVIKQGDDGDFLFVVDQGSLECFKQDTGLVLKTCNQGDVFGELSLLYNAPRAASVRAVGECVLWKLGRKTFTHIVRDGAGNKREKHFAFLKSVAILSKIGSYELSQIADALQPRDFGPDETIVSEGDSKADVFYILESGTANAFKSGFHVMNYTKPGEYFGELALIKDEPRAATVKAGSDGCTVLLLDRSAFKRLLGDLEDLVQKRYD